MPTKGTINQRKYDESHTRTFRIKLNLTIDKDIIEKLTAQPSMQGYIKELIRRDIANESVPNWESIVNLMDDEIREAIHADLSPCTEKEFFEEYLRRHVDKYGVPFKT